MFEPYLSEFIRYLHFSKNYSENTLLAYGHDLFSLEDFLSRTFENLTLTDVTHHHIRSWVVALKEEGLNEKSLKRKLSACSVFYKYLQKIERVKTNPVKQLHSLKSKKNIPQYLEENQTEMLFENINFPVGFEGFTHRLILELLYQCGLRRAELLQLQSTDIHWSLLQISIIGKGGKARLIPISSALAQMLRDYLSEKKKTFDTQIPELLVLKSGKKLYPNYIYRVVVNYVSQVSTLDKRSPHILRHTFATQLLRNGADLQSIKELLGHSSLAATQVYTHLAIDQLKDIHKKMHPKG